LYDLDKPLVLIVEDDPAIQQIYEKVLEGSMELLQATDLEMARKMLLENGSTLDAVVVDGHMPGQTTVEFIREVKEVFGGPIISASSDPGIRELQKAVGCSHDVTDKRDLPDKLRQVLGATRRVRR
jgi:CheY-like chemotaxis protein